MSVQGTDIRGQGPNAGNGILYADGIATTGQNSIIDSAGALISVAPEYVYVGTVTLVQLNAGITLIPAIPGRTIKPVQYLLTFNGTFTTATDIRLQDTAVSPVGIATVLIAAATAGAKISSEVVVANVTDGAGMNVNLTLGKGIQLVKTGSAAAGGTSIQVKIKYNVI